MPRPATFTLAALVLQSPAMNPALPQADIRPAVVIGQVVDASSGEGVRQAVVRLEGGGVVIARAADSQGRFFFRGLEPGSYTVTASQDRFFDGAFGRVRAGGDLLELPLHSGQWKADVTIELFRPAVVAGIVDDEGPEPLAGVTVQALRREFSGGRERFVDAGSTRTDDEGAYRLYDLVPGEYVIVVPSVQVTMPIATMEEVGMTGRSSGEVSAVISMNGGVENIARGLMSGFHFDADDRHLRLTAGQPTAPVSASGRPLAYRTVFHPGAEDIAGALPITLEPGQVRMGVHFGLRPVPAVRISGLLEGPDGPVPGLLMRLLPDGATDFGVGAEAAATLSAPDGSFTFLNVPSGSYVIHARSALAALPGWPRFAPLAGMPDRPAGATLSGPGRFWGEAPVTVFDRDVSDITVAMFNGATVSGRVVFDAPDRMPEASARDSLRVTLDTEAGQPADLPPAVVQPDGGFVIAGVRPGQYRIRTTRAPAGWHLKSATLFGRDVSRAPFDADTGTAVEDIIVTLTDRPATISGGVYAPTGQPLPGARVVAVPAGRGAGIDPRARPADVRSTRANLYGVYTLAGLAPGSYDLLAVDEKAAVHWQDPAELARLSGQSVRVTVREGPPAQQSLRAAAMQGGHVGRGFSPAGTNAGAKSPGLQRSAAGL